MSCFNKRKQKKIDSSKKKRKTNKTDKQTERHCFWRKIQKKLFQKNIENSHDHLRESWLLHGQEQQMDLNPLFNPPKIH